MKSTAVLILSLFLTSLILQAQDKYMTKVGHIGFYSKATMEEIKADNNEVTSIVNIKTGEMAFVALMKSFKFNNALMEEHFNENYAESDKFPKAKFKGTIAGIAGIDHTKPGNYDVEVEGDLEIHGVTKHLTQKGSFEVKDGKIVANSKYTILLKDFGMTIESALSDKIAESVEVSVDMSYELIK
ncbi:MAG: YceI family protein [Salinivirgaceae bacterium]